MSKKKVLCWSDAPNAGTGYGTVSRHIIGALHNTGRYRINQIAINSVPEFSDDIPWQTIPANMLDPSDTFGIKAFYRALSKTDYDIVWILNDLFIAHQAHEAVVKAKKQAQMNGKKPPIFIYYYPVDCKVHKDDCGMLNAADIIVCYTHHGKAETLKANPNFEEKLVEIPHGVDTNVFRPYKMEAVNTWKQELFGVSPETTVVLNVNRNVSRKQIPYSILAFKEFKKTIPDSMMYVHARYNDNGGNLLEVMNSLDLTPNEDIVFPNPSLLPTPNTTLSQLYNASDVFLTTHLGEGWGLTITEAMASGVPVVAPNNTCMPQQLGENSERGYMYECRDWSWIDNIGFRPKGFIPDIVNQMIAACIKPKYNNPKVAAAREWTQAHDWHNITNQWVELFDAAEPYEETNATITSLEEV